MASRNRFNHPTRAAYELRQRIFSGKLPGGARLREVAVAEELDISRTPAREAMARLAEEGLLDRLDSGGFVVRSFRLRDAVDAIELRGILEGTAARMAAEEGADPARLAEVEDTVRQIDGCFAEDGRSLDFGAYGELNARFHDQLASLCDSLVVRRELERVKSLPFASPSAFVLGRKPDEISARSLVIAQEQHRAIVAAIAAREGTRAEMLAREHARTARANLLASGLTDGGTEIAAPAARLIVGQFSPDRDSA